IYWRSATDYGPDPWGPGPPCQPYHSLCAILSSHGPSKRPLYRAPYGRPLDFRKWHRSVPNLPSRLNSLSWRTWRTSVQYGRISGPKLMDSLLLKGMGNGDYFGSHNEYVIAWNLD